jgi:hypothetical protein
VTSLTVLKRRSVRAREVWQLIRIATLARSPRHAFNLADRLGWDDDDCHSAAALAKIYFEYGQEPFENAVYGMQGEHAALLCLCECHRSGNPCGCCEFFDAECLCGCHECPTCDGWGWDDESDEVCIDSSDGFCDDCSDFHDEYEEGCAHPYGADEFWYGASDEDDDEEQEYEEQPDQNEPGEDWTEDDERHVGTSEPAVTPSPPTLDERLRKVAERLARQSGFSKSFKLVADIEGDNMQGAADHKRDTVLVTENLVRQLDEDELAFVLAHEIAHFEHDDASRMSGYVDGLAHDFSSNAEQIDARLKEKGRGFVTRTLAQVVHGVVEGAAGYVVVRGKSREHEQEADNRAIEIMDAAGFNSKAVPRALRKLHGGHAPDIGILRTLGSTHPNPASRVDEIARRAATRKKEEK